MTSKRVAVIIGATGVVGRGIVNILAEADWDVVAIARNPVNLGRVHPAARTLRGSVASEEDAATLAAQLRVLAPRVDAIVTTVNRNVDPVALLDLTASDLTALLHDNLVVHHIAARALLPLLATGGRYIGIGGGMADFIVPGMGPVSACQAAQRNLFHFYAMEAGKRGITVVELMLYAMIVDSTDDATAAPRSIGNSDVGRHVCAVLEQPDLFVGPILALKSRKQVGQPEAA